MYGNFWVKIIDNYTVFKAAERVANRFKKNFAVKTTNLQKLWDACAEADMSYMDELPDLEDMGSFYQEYPRTALDEITFGYKQLLEAMTISGCRKQKRYQAMVSWGLPLNVTS